MLTAIVLAMAEKAARADALENEVADLRAREADADARIERLTQILKAFDRARFGRRSEKLALRTATMNSRPLSSRARVHRVGARGLRPIWNGSKP